MGVRIERMQNLISPNIPARYLSNPTPTPPRPQSSARCPSMAQHCQHCGFSFRSPTQPCRLGWVLVSLASSLDPFNIPCRWVSQNGPFWLLNRRIVGWVLRDALDVTAGCGVGFDRSSSWRGRFGAGFADLRAWAGGCGGHPRRNHLSILTTSEKVGSELEAGSRLGVASILQG